MFVHKIIGIQIKVSIFRSLIIFLRYLFKYLWREYVKRKNGDHFTSFLTLLGSKKEEITPEEDIPEVNVISFLF